MDAEKEHHHDSEQLQGALVQDGAPSAAAKGLPSAFRGVAVLFVYCLHNAWNCWTMLTIASDVPSAEALLNVSESQIGLMNTLGTLSIMLFLPVCMFCRWRRALLAFGAVANVAPVCLRYFAAQQQNFPLVVLAMMLQGVGFAVIAVWPALIASLFFREERWALVIALGGLSNYVGGALGALFTPIMTGNTAEGLLWVLKLHVYLAVALSVLTVVWLWIPAVQEEDASLPLREEARACARSAALTQFVAFGTAVGVSIALQCSNPMILQDSGFSTNQAGVGNCVYQVAAAVVGVGLGGLVTQRKQLKRVIRGLHLVGVVSAGLLLVVCVLTDSRGRGPLLYGSMLVVEILLGASVMGMLPFVTQQLVYTAHPASENFITGFLNVIVMVVSTVMNYVCPSVGGVPSASIIFGLMLGESLCFAALQQKWAQAEAATDAKQ